MGMVNFTISVKSRKPTEKMRPGKIYALVVADYKEFPKYEKIWKEIFKLR